VDIVKSFARRAVPCSRHQHSGSQCGYEHDHHARSGVATIRHARCSRSRTGCGAGTRRRLGVLIRVARAVRGDDPCTVSAAGGSRRRTRSRAARPSGQGLPRAATITLLTAGRPSSTRAPHGPGLPHAGPPPPSASARSRAPTTGCCLASTGRVGDSGAAAQATRSIARSASARCGK
jgi:hypothetical protein